MAADMDTGIDWRGYLDKNYEDVPLHALRYSATRRINMFLCQEQVMTDDIVPNFGGLAELVGFDGIEIKVRLVETMKQKTPIKYTLE